jgi:phage terminase large subunit-like protein
VTRGGRNIQWIEQYCFIPEGRFVGQKVKLTPKQKKWIKSIYDTPTRTFILSMGRKNAKTAFAAFLCILHTAGPEAKPNSQLYSAGQSRDQAAILFNLMSKMVRMSPELLAVIQIKDSAKEIVCPDLGTKYKALSAEASTAYGLSPVFVVHDELGQVKGPRSELYEALETASAAQESPLSIVISTQAPTDADLLSVLIDDALTGADPRTKCILYTAPKKDDAFSIKTIKKANPHFDVFMNKEEVKRQASDASRMPSRESSYRNLILNQRVEARSPFVSRGVWESNADDPGDMSGKVSAGLDLSSRTDLTAFVISRRNLDGTLSVWPHFWAPENGIHDRSKTDRVPYDLWAEQGFLHTTPGSTVDYAFVAQEIGIILQHVDVDYISYDRWRIDLLKKEFDAIGLDLPLEPFGQGFKDMGPALEALEADLLNNRIQHGDHPILNMCAANAIATKDPAGSRKLDKSKTTGRIDGLVALAMAYGTATTKEPEALPTPRLSFI